MTTGPPMMAMLESYLKLSASREQAISANMANIDTPGYRTRDIDLEGELNKVMSGAMHSSEDGSQTVQLTPVFHWFRGLMERPDGNNVSLDHEGLMLAKTQLQYQLAIQLIQESLSPNLERHQWRKLIMNLFDSLSISGSALLAERERSEVIATNMANAQTTHTEAGGPYHRREVVFESRGASSLPAGPRQQQPT